MWENGHKRIAAAFAVGALKFKAKRQWPIWGAELVFSTPNCNHGVVKRLPVFF